MELIFATIGDAPEDYLSLLNNFILYCMIKFLNVMRSGRRVIPSFKMICSCLDHNRPIYPKSQIRLSPLCELEF